MNTIKEEVKRGTAPVRSNTYKASGVFAFGDFKSILKYEFSKNQWQAMPYHQNSSFKGEFKYTSCCRIAKSGEVLLSGGCSVLSMKASNKCFKLNTEDGQFRFNRIAPMQEPRYGHSQVYLNGYVYAIGGFNHDDDVGMQPSTLTSCEKYTPADNTWANCAELLTPRAYSGSCAFNNESIYVFGGLNGYETTNTIE